ncbi:hypothetical protein FisN_1Hh070 [Fistulifera solaris]|uniref:Calcium/calmodulin-dependent protein kinase II association-domain domain-containing protein n=1 Tax=Fistulifera solaris TaxID=1519565 RepID=A0A1Z5JDS1_FISSO|nr:hypothetical protein FisN_1Hh070 [Fistulifera solaris]|eukprot:GAX12145.1 hypothetical protein FisN_1Hh070 [Fistulifera solaris]
MKSSLSYSLCCASCVLWTVQFTVAFLAPSQITQSWMHGRSFATQNSPVTTIYSAVTENSFGSLASFNMPDWWKKVKPNSPEEIRKLFDKWNQALATGNPKKVAACYSSEAILIPTIRDEPRNTTQSIVDYFDIFLRRKPQAEIVGGRIKIGDGWAKDVGIYEFKFLDDGTSMMARYSFFYVKENGTWKILNHHSSFMPESVVVEQRISEAQVRNLFNLWNDALMTGDAEAVLNRYTEDAVVLPTASDAPLTNPNSIRNYYRAFLRLRPQCQILRSNVQIGTNWAKDSGIYEFVFQATGERLRGRFSFIYVYTHGRWKIAHHHSSIMPEDGVVANRINPQQVRALFDQWNRALATLDSSRVMDLYSSKASFIPTISGPPRITPGEIRDYYDTFLEFLPRAEILGGRITVGANWAQDTGIYEFTMGADGSKAVARYSFIYACENGVWKIVHHHSSVLPEEFAKQMAEKNQRDKLKHEEMEEARRKEQKKKRTPFFFATVGTAVATGAALASLMDPK